MQADVLTNMLVSTHEVTHKSPQPVKLGYYHTVTGSSILIVLCAPCSLSADLPRSISDLNLAEHSASYGAPQHQGHF